MPAAAETQAAPADRNEERESIGGGREGAGGGRAAEPSG